MCLFSQTWDLQSQVYKWGTTKQQMAIWAPQLKGMQYKSHADKRFNVEMCAQCDIDTILLRKLHNINIYRNVLSF